MQSVLAASPPTSRSSPARWLALVGFILLCNGVGFASSQFGAAGDVYSTLRQPSFAPPGWVFGPVWTLLYTLMGIATYLVWSRSSGEPRRTALVVFAVQLALNAVWTPVFFGLQQYQAAFWLLIAIWISVGAMFFAYRRSVSAAGMLVLPLWAWVTFAAVLNGAIVSLN